MDIYVYIKRYICDYIYVYKYIWSIYDLINGGIFCLEFSVYFLGMTIFL